MAERGRGTTDAVRRQACPVLATATSLLLALGTSVAPGLQSQGWSRGWPFSFMIRKLKVQPLLVVCTSQRQMLASAVPFQGPPSLFLSSLSTSFIARFLQGAHVRNPARGSCSLNLWNPHSPSPRVSCRNLHCLTLSLCRPYGCPVHITSVLLFL